MMARCRLPNRRGHKLLSFEHAGIYYPAGVGRFENGDLAESDVNTLRRALKRNSDGSASGRWHARRVCWRNG